MQGTSVASGETLSGGSEQHAGNTGKNHFLFIFFFYIEAEFLISV